MFITVAICTRNRASLLGRLMETIVALIIPADVKWELVVVDNGSTDNTTQVLAGYSDRLPLRCVSEAVPGLSNARNRAVNEARGDYICWTDDDVLLDKAWLASYYEAFVRFPETAIFGGPIRPVFEGEIPAWFSKTKSQLGALFAERDLGPAIVPFQVKDNEFPFGASYALRMREQRRHLYDPCLGVSPNQRRVGEEVALMAAIAFEGGQGLWIPEVIVEHIIPAKRVSLDYVRSYQRAAGETWAYLNLSRRQQNFMGPYFPPGVRSFLTAPFRVWRMTAQYGLRYPLAKLFMGPEKWMHEMLMYNFYIGALTFYLKNRKL